MIVVWRGLGLVLGTPVSVRCRSKLNFALDQEMYKGLEGEVTVAMKQDAKSFSSVEVT